eukprot:TRINITY_DN9702_c0_g1_i1.p1 TRINITY_DN9702_c0_g1~~TRINITY_DN9702_c0_g1_i1.p1  ORF type:complete len:129 (+),score=17.02 TRINITY_DN9702_c0_g1_i1:48-389(+)
MSSPQTWKSIHNRLKSVLRAPALTGDAHRSMVLSMYKQTMSELRIWPSVRRARVRQEVRLLYRQSAALTDSAEIQQAVQGGKNALQSLIDQNASLIQTGSNKLALDYTLKGPY